MQAGVLYYRLGGGVGGCVDGLDLEIDLPDGAIIQGGFMVVHYIAPDGQQFYDYRITGGLPISMLIGRLMTIINQDLTAAERE